MVEVDEVVIDSKTLDLSKSNSEPTEPNDDVFPIIPPEEIHETVETITLLEEKEVIKNTNSPNKQTHCIALYLTFHISKTFTRI